MAIDAIPVLTETGEGAQMAFFNGISADTTEELAGAWCGDLLQIVDELPEGFQLIRCCFAEIWSKTKDYFLQFGTNDDGYILKDNNGSLYEATTLDFYFKRTFLRYVKAEIHEKENKVKFVTVTKSE